jgi:hypothetical protein
MVQATRGRIRLLRAHDILAIAAAFAALGRDKPPAQYKGYLAKQRQGKREVLGAWHKDPFVGYGTVVWSSGYAPLRKAAIPEIADGTVLPHVRRQGMGSLLLAEAERRIAARSSLASTTSAWGNRPRRGRPGPLFHQARVSVPDTTAPQPKLVSLATARNGAGTVLAAV